MVTSLLAPKRNEDDQRSSLPIKAALFSKICTTLETTAGGSIFQQKIVGSPFNSKMDHSKDTHWRLQSLILERIVHGSPLPVENSNTGN